MNIFLTGATGFIGSHLLSVLLKQGHTITCFARNPDKIPCFRGKTGLRWIKGGLEDVHLLSDGLVGQDVCVHVALGWDDTARGMLEKDTLPAVALAETAARLKLRKFVYVSSSAAIGEYRPAMNEDSVCRPLDFYGAAKAAAEAYLAAVSRKYDLPCTVVRPVYVFGEPAVAGAPMEPDGRFRSMIKALRTDAPIEFIRNDGTQFIWVEDLTRLFLAVLGEAAAGRVYLAGAPEYVTWEEICLEARALLGSASRVGTRDLGWAKGACVYDFSRAAAELGLVFQSRDRITEHLRYLSRSPETVLVGG